LLDLVTEGEGGSTYLLGFKSYILSSFLDIGCGSLVTVTLTIPYHYLVCCGVAIGASKLELNIFIPFCDGGCCVKLDCCCW
jgi:hypothetical protein